MIKARFMAEQEPVAVKYYGGKVYAFICLNGEKKTEARTDYDGGEVTDTYWEYDYNEVVFNDGEIDVEDIKDNPEKYLNYPIEKPTELEQMRADIDYLLMVTEG